MRFSFLLMESRRRVLICRSERDYMWSAFLLMMEDTLTLPDWFFRSILSSKEL
jgi:hypothetical protein